MRKNIGKRAPSQISWGAEKSGGLNLCGRCLSAPVRVWLLCPLRQSQAESHLRSQPCVRRRWARLPLLLAVLPRASLDPSRVVMKWNQASRVGGTKTVWIWSTDARDKDATQAGLLVNLGLPRASPQKSGREGETAGSQRSCWEAGVLASSWHLLSHQQVTEHRRPPRRALIREVSLWSPFCIRGLHRITSDEGRGMFIALRKQWSNPASWFYRWEPWGPETISHLLKMTK